MKGYLKFKTKDGKIFVNGSDELTVLEARKYYNEKLKDRDDIISVYMIKWGTWNWKCCKVFKKEE